MGGAQGGAQERGLRGRGLWGELRSEEGLGAVLLCHAVIPDISLYL